LVALVLAGATNVAHAQGTMDFSGAQTLMSTFKTLTAFLRRADEGSISRLLVEASILLAASRGNATAILKDAATAYKVDTEAIATKVRQEFAAKANAKKEPKLVTKPAPKVKKVA
jgi:ParB family chromosome partitioning protein